MKIELAAIDTIKPYPNNPRKLSETAIEKVAQSIAMRSIKNHKPNIITDLFLGSGSTLIACEKLDRICYGMELDPKYCDVIVKRWEQWTGEKATK